MGATQSQLTKVEGEEKASYYTIFLLCGGSDDALLDEKKIVDYAAKKTTEFPGENGTQLHESANKFLDEFRRMLKAKGFPCYKFGRTGRSAPRIFRIDPNETMLLWETKKSARIAQGDQFDHILLSDITSVERGANPKLIPLSSEDNCRAITIHSPRRGLVLGFESSKRMHMFIDGLSLILAEIKSTAKKINSDSKHRQTSPLSNHIHACTTSKLTNFTPVIPYVDR